MKQYKLPVKYDDLHWTEKREVREQYKKDQGGLCYYCKEPLKEKAGSSVSINRSLFPPNFFKYPEHLHHSHDTGLTIGTVHNVCNAILQHSHDTGLTIGAVHNICNAILWQYHNE